jgi:hypothetical protein
MALNAFRIAASGILLLAACGDVADSAEEGATPSQGDAMVVGTTSAATGDAGALLPSSGDAGASVAPASAGTATPSGGANAATQPVTTTPVAADADAQVTPPTQQAFDYEKQTVMLTSDLVIPAGKTVRVGPGVTFNAASNVKIAVQGTLQVDGEAASPVVFAGGGEPSSWHGIEVAPGGQLTLQNAKIGGAQYGIHALPGSRYSIDHAVIDTSFKAAVLQSNGTLTNSTFKAVLLFPALTEEVSIDDPNGALTIMDASPTVTNCRFDGSGGLNDMIRVGGQASPVFDHIYVHSSHCGFHTSGGTNTSMRVTNSVLENLAYGVMAFKTQPIIEYSVFLTNSNDVGFCTDATADNTPKLRNNFYTDGAMKLDASCDRIGTKDAAPAAKASTTAGASGI